MRILREIQVHSPNVVFILENVKMSKKNQNIISQELGVEPVEINAGLVSAQNRRRLFWCNRPIRQPQDLGLVMNDILEDGFVSDRNKSFCIDANYWKGGNLKSYFKKHRRQLVFDKTALISMNCDREQWRKLTVKECERLQGMKDDFTKYDSNGKVIANTHRYKVIGNAFNVPVIQHILSEVL